MKRIKDISRKQPRIKVTGSTQPRIDPKTVAKALGAEIVAKRRGQLSRQYGLKKNPFESLTGLAVGKEFLLHVYWSGLDDGGDDGRGHLIQRCKVTADMGLENFPDPPPTAEEMQQVMFAAKIALLKILRKRKRAEK